jgi:adenosylcobinamide-GDP ribazoletransferase
VDPWWTLRALDGLRLAVCVLTVVPAGNPRADRASAGAAMLWAPGVGLLVGLAAGGVAAGGASAGLSAASCAVLALGATALLTRGLHLDGLADTADGLGAAGGRQRSLDVMRAPDIGPFGVATLILVLLLQATALAELAAGGRVAAAAALAIASAAGRLACCWACVRPIPAARPDGLGALVAGTVPVPGAAAVTVVLLAVAVAVAGVRGGLAVAAALGVSGLLLLHCARRFGGVTGDVLGALVESAQTAALVVLAAG